MVTSLRALLKAWFCRPKQGGQSHCIAEQYRTRDTPHILLGCIVTDPTASLADNYQCRMNLIRQPGWKGPGRAVERPISFKGCGDMKNKFAIFVLLLVIVAGVLAFSPIDRGATLEEPSPTVAVSSGVFMAEMETEVCAFRSEVHTTSAIRVTKTETTTEEMPTIYLVMLEDGVCASSSSTATTPRISVQAEQDQRSETETISRKEAAIGAEVGVCSTARLEF